MKKWLIAGGAALGCAALLLVYASGFGKDPHEVPFMLAGHPAPDFALKRLDTGEVVKLSQLKGKPLVLNFWATWCGPCKAEHPVLSWAARRLAGQVEFYGVLNEDTPENARAFLAENGTAYPQLLDVGGATGVDYGIAGVPETYFIDAAGIIREKYAYPFMEPEPLMAKVNTLLGGEARK